MAKTNMNSYGVLRIVDKVRPVTCATDCKLIRIAYCVWRMSRFVQRTVYIQKKKNSNTRNRQTVIFNHHRVTYIMKKASC
jgi:hypothetical protein